MYTSQGRLKIYCSTSSSIMPWICGLVITKHIFSVISEDAQRYNNGTEHAQKGVNKPKISEQVGAGTFPVSSYSSTCDFPTLTAEQQDHWLGLLLHSATPSRKINSS